MRYWEAEFNSIKPKRNSKGTRFYTKKDIEEIRKIHLLVKEQGYTLQGAREQLKKGKKKIDHQMDVVERLENVRNKLKNLRDEPLIRPVRFVVLFPILSGLLATGQVRALQDLSFLFYGSALGLNPTHSSLEQPACLTALESFSFSLDLMQLHGMTDYTIMAASGVLAMNEGPQMGCGLRMLKKAAGMDQLIYWSSAIPLSPNSDLGHSGGMVEISFGREQESWHHLSSGDADINFLH